MKTKFIDRSENKGFALIVTLSLMILLTVIAVGLLTLSTVSIRTSAEGSQLAAARANARLALMMAIGELQKSLGPDKAITATSGILAENPGKPGLTGIWKSWNFQVQGNNTYADKKADHFISWLVSTPDSTEAEDIDFGNRPWSGETITLAAENSFGGELPSTGAIVAGRVPIRQNGKEKGAFAWHVSDESVKARANLYRDPGMSDTLAEKRALLAGHRPDISVMKNELSATKLSFLPNDYDASSYKKANTNSQKTTSFNQLALGLGGDQARSLTSFRNDISIHSMGVLADARDGGLKQDLSSIFELSNSSENIKLPGDFQNGKLYESTIGVTGASDPKWSRLASYYNLFKDLKEIEKLPKLNITPEPFTLPNSAGTLPDTPNKFTPVPLVAKTQILMSYFTMENHGSPPSITEYQAIFCYTPIVTLHNPYNVELSFDILEVEIKNLPIGIKAEHPYGSFNPSTREVKYTPINRVYSSIYGRNPKPIVLKISNWNDYDKTATHSVDGNSALNLKLAEPALLRRLSLEENEIEAHSPIVMKPGETLICSPYLNPNAVVDTSRPETATTGRVRDHVPHQFDGPDYRSTIFDFGNQLSYSIKGKPGYGGPTIGMLLNHLDDNVHYILGENALAQTMNLSVKGVRPASGTLPVPENAVFEIENRIIMTKGANPINIGGARIEYGNDEVLDQTFQEVKVAFSGAETFVDGGGPGVGSPIKNMPKARPFALFTAAARMTSGGVNENGVRAKTSTEGNALLNGRYAGKPYLFHNASIPGFISDLQTSTPASQTYELSLEPVNRDTVNNKLFQISTENNSRFITGSTTQHGIKNGVVFEVPTGPMQTIADFRRSNALSSAYSPHFTQPVANSLATPLMNTNSAIQKIAGSAYTYMDHSVLANHALYDRFYFSTFAQNRNSSPADAFENFMSGQTPLISQSFEPYLPKGTSADAARRDLFDSSKPNATTYLKASQYQMVKGPFNINSTNVEAWKAKLASLKNSQIPVIKDGAINTVSAEKNKVPLPGVTFGISDGIDLDNSSVSDASRQNRWNGFRELEEKELQTLAENIVKEVRNRGPFLSMSEFVNRRVDSKLPESVRGVLETALDKSEINEKTFSDQMPITNADIADPAYSFKTPEASLGNPAAGAPGWVTQGDLMRILEPAVTVRSDTFVIRVCGEAGTGNNITRVYAEAVVQRFPDYIDSSEDPSTAIAKLNNDANKNFGRRLETISFRWLNQNEI